MERSIGGGVSENLGVTKINDLVYGLLCGNEAAKCRAVVGREEFVWNNEAETASGRQEPEAPYDKGDVNVKAVVQVVAAIEIGPDVLVNVAHADIRGIAYDGKYFQGKRRIPAPTVLRRHAGRSELALLAGEILGLSKMDWNSADLYSKLPATVYSSKQIARLGMLLERFGPLSYDYRLFI